MTALVILKLEEKRDPNVFDSRIVIVDYQDGTTPLEKAYAEYYGNGITDMIEHVAKWAEEQRKAKELEEQPKEE